MAMRLTLDYLSEQRHISANFLYSKFSAGFVFCVNPFISNLYI